MFSLEEKQIYSCPHTGRKYDPLVVKRALLSSTKGAYSALCAEGTETARGTLVAAARQAFGLPPVDTAGAGVLEAIVWEALCSFSAYLAGKGPRVQNSPASAPCTDCQKRAAPTTTS